jgi:hypothetical protein
MDADVDNDLFAALRRTMGQTCELILALLAMVRKNVVAPADWQPRLSAACFTTSPLSDIFCLGGSQQ